MPPNIDQKRVYDGFVSLDAGINYGLDPSLIQNNQASFSGNTSLRGSFPVTRPPFYSNQLSFDSSTTQTNFSGVYQGSCYYQAPDESNNSIIVSIGGRLFRIWVAQNNLVTEITPVLVIVVTADFTVPAPAASVLVSVTTEAAFSVGDSLLIDGGSYTVTNRSSNQITVTYNGGAAHATVASGTAILTAGGLSVTLYHTNPSTYDFVYLFQAENYVIVLAQNQTTLIFDGFKTRLAGLGELPSGFVGVYAWGRIWMSLSDQRSFIAGDLVQSASGTPANNFVDSILKVTENTFLNGGGSFKVPATGGIITAIVPLATQDTSLGIGPILVGTIDAIYSVNAPVDRTTWQNLTYPIQTIALLNFGPAGPRCAFTINGDLWYRSLDGVRSFISARRDFDYNRANTPMSFELSPVLNKDGQDLLFYGSGVFFDNRMLMTTAPTRTSNGVTHDGFVVVNFDSISNIQNKNPPIWESVFTGLKILDTCNGPVKRADRFFIFALRNGAIELWELLKENSGFTDSYLRNGVITNTRIQTWLNTKAHNFGDSFQLKKLVMAELYFDRITDNVSVTVKFKPDQYPTWITWATINLCANVSQCSFPSGGTCSIFKTRAQQYAARIRLPRPPESCNVIVGMPLDRGYEFQFRIEGTGYFRVKRFRIHTMVERDAMEGQCPSEKSCTTFESCEDALFNYNAYGT